MKQAIDDAIRSILEQTSSAELRMIPADAIAEMIDDIQQGRSPQSARATGGFGFGAEVLVEHLTLGIHVALAVIHSAQLLQHHYNERQMREKLEQIAKTLDEKIDLTDAIVEKLKRCVGSP